MAAPHLTWIQRAAVGPLMIDFGAVLGRAAAIVGHAPIGDPNAMRVLAASYRVVAGTCEAIDSGAAAAWVVLDPRRPDGAVVVVPAAHDAIRRVLEALIAEALRSVDAETLGVHP